MPLQHQVQVHSTSTLTDLITSFLISDIMKAMHTELKKNIHPMSVIIISDTF